ncbi:MAG: cysteine desulfurase [candidate division FCPU426 bacterium]
MLDLLKIRADFPILSRLLNGKPLAYLDSAATSQKPLSVIQSLVDFYSHSNANIHRAAHGMGNEATSAFEEARAATATFIGANSPNEVVFTRNATEAINLVAQAWGRAHVGPGDEIVISEMEHHANLVPWHMLAKETGAVLKFIPVRPDGRLDMEQAAALFSDRTRMLALSWVSNVLGTINPVKELTALAKKRGAMVLLDAAQAAPHFALDLKDSGADFAAFSAHKLLGPTGVGVLWGKEAVLDAMPPWQGGGSMIRLVSRDAISYNRVPWRFEAGTPDIGGVIAFHAALRYLSSLGWDAMQAHEKVLGDAALKRFASIPGFKLFGPSDMTDRLAVFSFDLEGVNCQDIGALLDSMGVAIRTGNHCAQPLMGRFQVSGMARVSFYLYNTLDEVERAAQAIEKARKILGMAAKS